MSSVQPLRHRFTVDEYFLIADAGIFGVDARVELLDGEIIEMHAIGSRHANFVAVLNGLLVRAAGDGAMVRPQSPIRLSDLSAPEPDIALVRRRAGGYAASHPVPADVHLLVEVSDSTLKWDRDVKVPLYGKAGIPTCWIVDLQTEAVHVFTEPGPSGYGHVETRARGARLDVLGTTLTVDAVLD